MRVMKARHVLLYARCADVPWPEMSDDQDIKDSDDTFVVVVVVIVVVIVEIVIVAVVVVTLEKVIISRAKRNR